jgi:hypothetical protein
MTGKTWFEMLPHEREEACRLSGDGLAVAVQAFRKACAATVTAFNGFPPEVQAALLGSIGKGTR